MRRTTGNPVTNSPQTSSSVRRYTVGDSLNRIHWKSSAKLNRLDGQRVRDGGQSDLAILLDSTLPCKWVTA